METVIVAFNDRELYERYQADVEAFFNSWSFVRSEKSEPEAAPRSRTEPAPVRRPRKSGRDVAPFQIGELYVANILVNRPKTYGLGYEYVSWNEFWLILPGGRVYFGMPPGDPGDLEWDAVRREHPEKIAACSVTGAVQVHLAEKTDNAAPWTQPDRSGAHLCQSGRDYRLQASGPRIEPETIRHLCTAQLRRHLERVAERRSERRDEVRL